MQIVTIKGKGVSNNAIMVIQMSLLCMMANSTQAIARMRGTREDANGRMADEITMRRRVAARLLDAFNHGFVDADDDKQDGSLARDQPMTIAKIPLNTVEYTVIQTAIFNGRMSINEHATPFIVRSYEQTKAWLEELHLLVTD